MIKKDANYFLQAYTERKKNKIRLSVVKKYFEKLEKELNRLEDLVEDGRLVDEIWRNTPISYNDFGGNWVLRDNTLYRRADVFLNVHDKKTWRVFVAQRVGGIESWYNTKHLSDHATKEEATIAAKNFLVDGYPEKERR